MLPSLYLSKIICLNTFLKKHLTIYYYPKRLDLLRLNLTIFSLIDSINTIKIDHKKNIFIMSNYQATNGMKLGHDLFKYITKV